MNTNILVNKVKVVIHNSDGLTQTKTESIEISQLTNYENLIVLLSVLGILNQTKQKVIFLKQNNGDMLTVKQTNFYQVIKKIFERTTEDEAYFIVQDQAESPLSSLFTPELFCNLII